MHKCSKQITHLSSRPTFHKVSTKTTLMLVMSCLVKVTEMFTSLYLLILQINHSIQEINIKYKSSRISI